PRQKILYNLQTKKGDVFSIDTVRADVRRLYALGYFEDITHYEEEGKNGKLVIFSYKENTTVRAVEYKGNKKITKTEFLKKMRVKKVGVSQESPYDTTRIRRAEAVIKGMLAEKGLQNATIEVTTEPVPPNSINLTFNIEEGPKVKIEK